MVVLYDGMEAITPTKLQEMQHYWEAKLRDKNLKEVKVESYVNTGFRVVGMNTLYGAMNPTKPHEGHHEGGTAQGTRPSYKIIVSVYSEGPDVLLNYKVEAPGVSLSPKSSLDEIKDFAEKAALTRNHSYTRKKGYSALLVNESSTKPQEAIAKA